MTETYETLVEKLCGPEGPFEISTQVVDGREY